MSIPGYSVYMFDLLRRLLRSSTTRPVFVIGTGRSGTHWLGFSLGSHPEIRATVEEQPMFKWSTKMALDRSTESKVLPKLVAAYKGELRKSSPRIYVDKSHPNIWIADKLLDAFPSALFVGIVRNPYATVSSMMKHPNVAAWHTRWREFPVPNRFLGITPENAGAYDGLCLAAQCAMRWKAHRDQMRVLGDSLGPALFAISYEDFSLNTDATIRQLQIFLRLKAPIPVPEVKRDSLEKWRSHLTPQEVAEIERVVGFGPDSPDNGYSPSPRP